MEKVKESIFSGETTIIPMADVQHIEKHWFPSDTDRNKQNYRGIKVITKNTRWNREVDDWDNNIYLSRKEAESFIECWCRYRSEVEDLTLQT